jgi:hypothetical protein
MSQQASLRHHTTQPTSPEAPLHNFTPHWTLPKIDNGPKCRLCGIAGSDQCQDFLLQLRAAVEAAAQPAASGSTGATALVLSLRRLRSPPHPAASSFSAAFHGHARCSRPAALCCRRLLFAPLLPAFGRGHGHAIPLRVNERGCEKTLQKGFLTFH